MSQSNSSIEKQAVQLVKEYLECQGKKVRDGKKGEGADIISGEVYIDVKGCLGKATNLRMVQQALESIAEQSGLKQGSFFIYYVYNMSTKPELLIFDYQTFKRHKIAEIKWIIQPHRIVEAKGEPQPEKDFPCKRK